MAVLFVSCGFVFGQEVTLDLSKPTLDSTLWKTSSPSTSGASSHQYVQGRLALTNGEWLYLADPPSSVVSVEGSFTLRDRWDIMHVILNSAGDPSIPTGQAQHPADGVIVAMGGIDNSGVAIGLLGPNRKNLSTVPTTFNVGETYRFLIVDDGTNLSVTVNDNKVTAANYRSEQGFIDGGSNVILQNREGWPGGHTAYIHSYKISSPQVSTFQIIEGNFTWQEAKADALTAGRLSVMTNPSGYGLYNAASYNAVIAERDARPSQAALDAVIAERDARPTPDQIKDARLGSVVLVPNIIEENEQIVQIRFRIEESNDLGIWESRQEVAEINIPIKPGKKFYRFSVNED